jgi:hypothetical protein
MLLAISFVDLISGPLSSSIYKWSTPLDAPQKADYFLNPANPALWVIGVSFISLLFIQFVFSGEPEE